MIIAGVVGAHAAPADKSAMAAGLQKQLSTLTTPADSLKVLYDIYDVSPVRDRKNIGKDIFLVAGRAGDVKAQLDILRLLSNEYHDAGEIMPLISKAASLPRSREQIETVLFLKMRRLSYATRKMSQDEQIKELSTLINKLNTTSDKKQNRYDRLYNLYAATCYLRHQYDSKVLTGYVDTLVHMVNTSDYALYALRNQIYSEAARIYSDAGMQPQAIAADRKLLQVIDGLDKTYQSKGRKYRNMDISRYVAYRRMLRNYKGMTPAEVEQVYNAIMRIASTDSDVASNIRGAASIEPYYLMARNRYADAIPAIKKAIPKEKALPRVRQLYEMLQTAARQTGDSATLLASLSAYNDIVNQLDSLDAARKYKELQVAYDVSSLKEHNLRLRMEKAEADSHQMRQKMTITSVAWIIIAILLVVLLFYWTRYRTNMSHLSRFAINTARQRDMLKNNRYSEYDAAEFAPRKVPVVHDSKHLIQSIINDILYISALGNDERKQHIDTFSINDIVRRAEQSYQATSNPGSTLSVEYADPDFKVSTDAECLEYLLKRIFSFAQKNSQNDDATASIRRTAGYRTFHITFTHSGQRITRGNEESLFINFIDRDTLSDREDSTLFVCRLIAFLLHCNFSLNPHVAGPPQLIISMPVELDKQ